MGRTSRWFRSLLGSSKTSSDSSKDKTKKQWAPFAKSSNHNKNNVRLSNAPGEDSYDVEVDANKHAIAVAAATAAVAEAALAAAQAAAEVVRLTSGGGGSRPGTAAAAGRRREWAAVKIQSAFRAYLARRALRALKGLVRLQALVRGHIIRKQSADMLRRMQALARIQARVCANRAYMSESPQSSTKSSQSRNHGLATPRKVDNKLRAHSAKSDRSPTKKNPRSNSRNGGSFDLEKNLKGANWLNRWMDECSWNNQGETSLTTTPRPDDEKSDKILEIDTCYPHLNLRQTEKVKKSYSYGDHGVTMSESLSRNSTKSRKQNPSISSGEALSLSSVKYPPQIDETALWTSENNSPQVYSVSSRPGSSSGRKGHFTPTRSECSRSFLNGYQGYPNYMANTESYNAKVRSHSAPRQRIFRGYCDSDTISESGSILHDPFRNKAYSGSTRSDKPVIQIRGNYTTSSYADRS